MENQDIFAVDVIEEAINLASMTAVYEEDVTFNFENQAVYIPHHNRRSSKNLKKSIRAVYRISLIDGNLYGSIFRDRKWNPVKYDNQRSAWYLTENII